MALNRHLFQSRRPGRESGKLSQLAVVRDRLLRTGEAALPHLGLETGGVGSRACRRASTASPSGPRTGQHRRGGLLDCGPPHGILHGILRGWHEWINRWNDPPEESRFTAEYNVDHALRVGWDCACLAVSDRAEGEEVDEKPEFIAERKAQLLLLRDIFGNPFPQTDFDPAWRSPDTLALARVIYEEQAFDLMPVLGDALRDAGCALEEILGHCRNSLPHVRGCWLVDFLLGHD